MKKNNAKYTIKVEAPLLRPGMSITAKVSKGYASDTAENLLSVVREINGRDDEVVLQGSDPLFHAVYDLYMAGKWECKGLNKAQQKNFWERVKYAAGIEDGTATKAGVNG